jgi:hypothetical protein
MNRRGRAARDGEVSGSSRLGDGEEEVVLLRFSPRCLPVSGYPNRYRLGGTLPHFWGSPFSGYPRDTDWGAGHRIFWVARFGGYPYLYSGLMYSILANAAFPSSRNDASRTILLLLVAVALSSEGWRYPPTGPDLCAAFDWGGVQRKNQELSSSLKSDQGIDALSLGGRELRRAASTSLQPL